MKVAVYTRVSTGYQVDKDSLPLQRKECTAFAKHVLHKNNIEIYEDAGRSGKDTDRPGFKRMMTDIKNGEVSHVIVYKIDRISRNLIDFSLMLEDFKCYGASFISLNEQFDTSSAIGEAVLKIILVFAELERKMTSERVKAVMISRAKEGLWNGANVPFGWRWDPKTERPLPDPEESLIVKEIFNRYEETRSSGEVQQWLLKNQIATKRGGQWTIKAVLNILHNPLNCGDLRYNYRESARGRRKPADEVVYVKDVYPAIISREQWDRVNATITARALAHGGYTRQSKHIHVFSGLLTCGECGSNIYANRFDTPRANGFKPSNYMCSNKQRKLGCTAPMASDVVLGPFVFNLLRNLINVSAKRKEIKTTDDLEKMLTNGIDVQIRQESLENLLNTIGSGPLFAPEGPSEESSEDTKKIYKQIDKYKRALKRLKKVYLFDDDAMDEKEYLATRQDLETAIVALENETKAAKAREIAQPTGNLSFLTDAQSFLLTHSLQSNKWIKYNELAPMVGQKPLQDFVRMAISDIVIFKGKASEITFASGLNLKFLH